MLVRIVLLGGKSAVPATFMRAAAMAGLDQMNEQELIRELQRLANECHRLDQEISYASQQRRFCKDRCDIAGLAQDEQTLAADLNRLMDSRRAVEGHLTRVRGHLRPLKLHEQGEQ